MARITAGSHEVHELTGKTLRWVVCLMLKDARRAMTVAEIVRAVEGAGYRIAGGRAGKSVSDALRWEVRRGRVVQLRRGLYGAGAMQRSTEWSMRRRVHASDATHVSLVAPTAAGPRADAAGPADAVRAADAFVPSIDLDALDTTDAWSGPARAVAVDDW